MIKKILYFLATLVSVFLFFQIFIYSSKLSYDDDLHQKNFNRKYGIFSIVQKENVVFAGEKVGKMVN